MFDSEIPEEATTSSFDSDNPLAKKGADDSLGKFTPSRVQIVPESHEPEDGHEEEEPVDFFEVIARALVVGKKLDPDHIQADMKLCFEDIPDHGAKMEPAELVALVEDHLSLKLNEREQGELLEQIQGVRKAGGEALPTNAEPISVADFERWWDSFFEAETMDPFRAALAEMEKSGMISPTSSFRGNWDLIQAVLLFYIAGMLPYRIGFAHDVVLWSFWFWLDLIIDIYFVCDLCLNFRTAVITSDGELLYKSKDIAMNYLKGWLPVDFVSCLPFGYIPYILGEDAGGSGNKATRMLRMFRLLKLLRLVRIKRILDRWEEEMYGKRMLKFGKIVFLVGGTAHWVACLWYWVGADPDTVGYVLPGGAETDGWVYRKYGSPENVDSVSMVDRYKDSLFWSTMAVIMIDACEDHSTPETFSEKLTYAISFCAGAAIIAAIIGQISDMIAHANPGDQSKSDSVSLVHAFLYERHVGVSLTRRVRQHFNQHYTCQGTTQDIQSIFDGLPQSLKLELAVNIGFVDDLQTNRRATLSKVPFVRGLSANDMIRISCKMKYCGYEPPHVNEDGSIRVEDFIMRQGERGVEMWVILEGKVRVECVAQAEDAPIMKAGDGQGVDLGKLGMTEFFGENAVLMEESPGVPLRRIRSAYGITQTVLTW